ncbi:YraN family protein [Candidatus Woesebacteria bacterium RBG_16_34_12]|uniref:UPF0102 protein A2Z22_04645 n=1 Tax=Candidatus Woesebacteria bacterium RBG_16_34_12 TaxID=1802480 RepID=A0A1F7XBU5_9BACT|nr:MAG: YraN family protein [Candidatus Woesebacteria bacterium RBG_16_34_12]
MDSKISFGNLGENYAARILQENGYQIIDRNFRTKFGEIDIIAVDKDTLVFIEVKTRWGKKYGSPEEAVTPRKITKIKRVAEIFINKNKNLPKKLRIDVVAIEVKNENQISAKIIS